MEKRRYKMILYYRQMRNMDGFFLPNRKLPLLNSGGTFPCIVSALPFTYHEQKSRSTKTFKRSFSPLFNSFALRQGICVSNAQKGYPLWIPSLTPALNFHTPNIAELCSAQKELGGRKGIGF